MRPGEFAGETILHVGFVVEERPFHQRPRLGVLDIDVAFVRQLRFQRAGLSTPLLSRRCVSQGNAVADKAVVGGAVRGPQELGHTTKSLVKHSERSRDGGRTQYQGHESRETCEEVPWGRSQ